MIIEIKLNDPKYCHGCPCLQTDDFYGDPDHCSLDDSYKFKEIEEHYVDYGRTKVRTKAIRPQECIDRCGE